MKYPYDVKATKEELFETMLEMYKEIERLNNIINEIDFYVYERMRDIWVKAEGDIGKVTYKELVSLHDKIKELKGVDKE